MAAYADARTGYARRRRQRRCRLPPPASYPLFQRNHVVAMSVYVMPRRHATQRAHAQRCRKRLCRDHTEQASDEACCARTPTLRDTVITHRQTNHAKCPLMAAGAVVTTASSSTPVVRCRNARQTPVKCCTSITTWRTLPCSAFTPPCPVPPERLWPRNVAEACPPTRRGPTRSVCPLGKVGKGNNRPSPPEHLPRGMLERRSPRPAPYSSPHAQCLKSLSWKGTRPHAHRKPERSTVRDRL
jgi:hypothetical protein